MLWFVPGQRMRTFSILTLGCKVNQYEGEQIASLLRSRGLVQVSAADARQGADLHILHTCSVTNEAAAQSRQAARRLARLPGDIRPRVVVTGCWATSNSDQAAQLPGVDAVITHDENIAEQLHLLLDQWQGRQPTFSGGACPACRRGGFTGHAAGHAGQAPPLNHASAISLPLLDSHQAGHQRAVMKIQDGCDAMCTYCIIPQLRPRLWSKPLDDAVREAQALVDAGHLEIVLTGIFLSAYGQSTAIRRRQNISSLSLAGLINALCTRVRGLVRLRLSSLEPGDLTPELLSVLGGHAQVVPHFHLPLQSGSDAILRRMNRQYRRDDFLQMIDAVRSAFDRPALTTDVIVGFPGETDGDFADTLNVVDRAGFVHIHAFPFSPRPGTTAARWKVDTAALTATPHRLALLQERARHRVFLSAANSSMRNSGCSSNAPRRAMAIGNMGVVTDIFRCIFFPGKLPSENWPKYRVEQITPQRTVGTLT